MYTISGGQVSYFFISSSTRVELLSTVKAFYPLDKKAILLTKRRLCALGASELKDHLR
jgi:hypothetical protein